MNLHYKLVLLLLGFSLNSMAQAGYEIKGRLLDSGHQPVAFATVEIIKTATHQTVQATQADTGGHFKLAVAEKGDYVIKISAMGMDSLTIGITIAEDKLVQLPDVTLIAAQHQLKEVAITGKKPFIEQKIDRTVLNVESSILASGRTALDVLANAPGVIVDNQHDNISLNNKTGVMVMINGRKNYLSSADLNNMLRNMSSEQIATIELITNPSAKYDASGTAGIIDIKLKKSQYFGTNGSASATISQGLVPYGPANLSRGSVNLNLNNRTEKWNTYININPNAGNDYSQTTLHRTVDFANSATTFDGFNPKPGTGAGISTRIGIDYSASSKTTIGLLVDGQINRDKASGTSTTQINDQTAGVTTLSSLAEHSNTQSPRRNITTNLNMKHDFNAQGSNLAFDATYSGYRNRKDQTFSTDYFDNTGNFTNNTTQRNETEADIHIYTVKADLTVPFSKSFKFEVGLKSDYVRTVNDDRFDQLLAGQWHNIPTQSNNFVYTENVNAAYVNFNKAWAKWAIQAGLRAEQTHSNGNSVTDHQVADSSYLSWFPSIFISQTIDKDNSLRYSYSRRIDRPNYQQLNPFVFFIDPYTVIQGNPFLRPQFTDSYQASYSYKGMITLAIGYARTKDQMIQFTRQNDSTKVIEAIQGNLGSDNRYYANLSFPVEISNWWSMQNQLNFNHDQLRNTLSPGDEFNRAKFQYNFTVFNSFKLSDTWSAELSFNYASPAAFGIERSLKPNYSTNAGLQKSLFHKRARLSFNISDIFLTAQYNGLVQYQNVDLAVLNRWTSRRVGLSFSYNFGKQSVKSPRSRSTGAETLKNRAN